MNVGMINYIWKDEPNIVDYETITQLFENSLRIDGSFAWFNSFQ